MSPWEQPNIPKPSYQQVCRGDSGHIEVLYVILNEPEQHFEEVIRFFFQFHDPTTHNRQGNDQGFQYASWIFCDDSQQYQIAMRVRQELQALLDAKALARGTFVGTKVTTKVTPGSLRTFTAAHQEYLAKNPNGYCNHRIRFKQWPTIVPNTSGSDRACEEKYVIRTGLLHYIMAIRLTAHVTLNGLFNENLDT